MTLQVLWTRALAVLHRLVGLLVHAHPAGVPRRPGRRRRGVRALRASGRRTRCAGWRRCTSPSPAAVGLSYLFTDKLPLRLHLAAASSSFGVDAVSSASSSLACLAVLPATLLMGGVFPLTVARRRRASSTRSGTTSANAYALNTRRRDRRLVPVGLRGAAEARPAARDLRRGRGAVSGWRRLLFARRARAGAPAPPAGVAAGGRPGPRGPRPAALEPGQLSRRGSSASRSRATTSTARSTSATGRTPSWSSTRTASPPRSASIAGARSTRSRTTARSTPRTTPTCPPRSSSACCRCCSIRGTHPPKVALIGFGSGVTAGAITQYPIASLEVVELEPAVYRGLALLRQRTTTARSKTPRSPRASATAATS